MNSYRFRLGLLPLFCFLVSPGPAHAGDWPQWRGPNRDGVSAESGLLKSWPEGGPRLLWTAKDLGRGYSTVAVVGDRIYTAGDRGETSYVVALNAADGKEVWSTKLGRAGAPGGFAGARATPTVTDKELFAVNQWGEMVCLDLAKGEVKWRKDFTKDFGGKAPGWGYSESPLADGKLVAVTPGGANGAVVAMDQQTGEVLWRTKDFTDDAHYSSLVIGEIGGVRQYIQLTPASVAGVAATDGKLLWRAVRKGQTAVIPTPICRDNLVYVCSGYGIGCNLFKVTSQDGKFSASQVYANKAMVNQHGGAVCVGDFVYGYCDSKGWTCQDLKTGEIKWQEKNKLGKGSLVCAGGMLVLRQEDGKGTVVLLEATPDGYQEKGRFDQPNRSSDHSWPHPVVANGRLYLRDQNLLLCYDVRTSS